MRRNTTVMTLCGLLILADLIIFKQTIAMSGGSNGTVIASAISLQCVSAILLACLGLTVYRKTYRRQKKPVSSRERFALVQPLRRLFVSVWP